MTCELVIHRRVVLVVWGKPELADLQLVEQEVLDVYAERGPVIFVARVPPSAEGPSEEVRAELTAMLDRFMTRLVGFYAVLEGRGFLAAAKRTILATAFLMAGKRHGYHVHATVDEVVKAVPAGYRSEVAQAVDYFRSRGHLVHSLRPMVSKARAS